MRIEASLRSQATGGRNVAVGRGSNAATSRSAVRRWSSRHPSRGRSREVIHPSRALRRSREATTRHRRPGVTLRSSRSGSARRLFRIAAAAVDIAVRIPTVDSVAPTPVAAGAVVAARMAVVAAARIAVVAAARGAGTGGNTNPEFSSSLVWPGGAQCSTGPFFHHRIMNDGHRYAASRACRYRLHRTRRLHGPSDARPDARPRGPVVRRRGGVRRERVPARGKCSPSGEPCR